MEADTKYRNFWQDTFKSPSYTNNTVKDREYDVIIVGAGIAAVTTALTLQDEGKNCLLISSLNFTDFNMETGVLTVSPDPESVNTQPVDTATLRLIAKSKREAADLVEGLISKYDIDCDFTYETGYLFARTPEEATAIQLINAIAHEAGIVSKEAVSIPISVSFTKAYRFDFQAKLHPLKYLSGLTSKLAGGILMNCGIHGIEYDNEAITVHTAAGTFKANNLVYADDTENVPGYISHGTQKSCYNLAFSLQEQLYPDGITYDMAAPGHTIATYVAKGKQYVLVTGYGTDEAQNMNEAYIDAEECLKKYFNIDEVTYRWVNTYFTGANNLPAAGRMPGHRNIFVISGLGNNAIVNGAIGAKLVCSLMAGKPTDYAELYAPANVQNRYK